MLSLEQCKRVLKNCPVSKTPISKQEFSNQELQLHSGIFADNFFHFYINPCLGMFEGSREAEKLKELEFVVKLRCFSAKME